MWNKIDKVSRLAIVLLVLVLPLGLTPHGGEFLAAVWGMIAIAWAFCQGIKAVFIPYR